MKKVKFIGKSNFVGCINGKVYDVQREENGFYWIEDEAGDDEYRYSKRSFEDVAGSEEENKKEYNKKLRFKGESFEWACVNGKTYDCVGEEHNCYIIIDECGSQALYTKDQFEEV